MRNLRIEFGTFRGCISVYLGIELLKADKADVSGVYIFLSWFWVNKEKSKPTRIIEGSFEALQQVSWHIRDRGLFWYRGSSRRMNLNTYRERICSLNSRVL